MKLSTFLCGTVLALMVTLASAADVININTADAPTLAAVLDGVGPNKAAAIVDYREANGPFGSVDDLSEVKGIGARTVDINRDRLTVQ